MLPTCKLRALRGHQRVAGMTRTKVLCCLRLIHYQEGSDIFRRDTYKTQQMKILAAQIE